MISQHTDDPWARLDATLARIRASRAAAETDLRRLADRAGPERRVRPVLKVLPGGGGRD